MNQDIFVLVEHLQNQVLEISYMLAAQARQIVGKTGGKVVAVLLGANPSGLVKDLAVDEVLCFDHPALEFFTSETYQIVLADLLGKTTPGMLLFGETSMGAETAAGLSARLNLPVISSCASIQPSPNGFNYTCKICAGKLMAEGEIPADQTTLVTLLAGAFKAEAGKSQTPPKITPMAVPDLSALKIKVKQIIASDQTDVDIAKEAILVSVGRGIQQKDNIELAEELAEALGGVVCGSRPVIDQGWLSPSRLVGKSGKAVKPKIYLALGISGAPEHVEAITGSELIVAINTDPASPIFNLAKYGATIDLLELLPTLSEQIRQEKGN